MLQNFNKNHDIMQIKRIEHLNKRTRVHTETTPLKHISIKWNYWRLCSNIRRSNVKVYADVAKV